MKTRVEKAILKSEFVERYLRTGTPVVITDVVPKWPAFGRWTWEHLAAVAGEEKIPVTCSSDGIAYERAEKKRITLAELVRASNEAGVRGSYYAQGINLAVSYPQLLSEVPVPGYLDMNRFKSASLWVGRGTTTPIHWRPRTEVFMGQLQGPKRFTFYSPDQFEILRPCHWNSPGFNENELTYTRGAPDARARPLSCTLQPGELLYIPIHWWHLVETDDWSVSVVFEWVADGRSRRFGPQRLHHLKGTFMHLPGLLYGRLVTHVKRMRFRDRYTVQRFD